MWGDNDIDHDEECLAERCPECGARDTGPTTRLRYRARSWMYAHRRRRTLRIVTRWSCQWCSYAASRYEFDSSEMECICGDLLEQALEAQAEAAVDWGYER
jgi:hypothetical protein